MQRPKNHECYIGLLYEYDETHMVTLGGLQEYIQDTIRYNRWVDANFERSDGLYKKDWTLADYADHRKSTNMRQFCYCPDCGKKIDWKKIKEIGGDYSE